MANTGNLSGLVVRVREACDSIWRGSQSDMARDLGVPQPTISLVIRGAREPGRELLVALCRHPLIDPAWLMTGAGLQLPHHRPTGHGWEIVLPCTDRLLPGPPTENAHLLSGEQYCTTRSDARPSRYWHRVPEQSDFLACADRTITLGDRLLLECNARYWRGKLDALVGRPCVTIESNVPVASRLSRRGDQVVPMPLDGARVGQGRAREPRDTTQGKRDRVIMLDEKIDEPARVTPKLIAVAVLLVRHLPGAHESLKSII